MSKTLISILAGLGGMLGWGTADFFANFGSDTIGHRKTFFYSQLVALSILFLLFIFLVSSFQLNAFLFLLTVFTGVTYTLGYLFFYKGFEIGNVSVVSAVINLNAVFTALTAFFIFKQRISGLQTLAILVVLLGVTLVSINLADFRKGSISVLKGVKESVLAAICFGFLFWPINEYIVERADWLLVNLLTKIVAVLVVFIFLYFAKQKIALGEKSKKVFSVLFLIGSLDTVGLLSVSYGLSAGDSIIILPVSSALTLVTVSLAVIFLKEKLSKIQIAGILMTVAGIIMMGL